MASPAPFQRATVTRIVRENADVRTFVLDPHEGPFSYRAGQFCTFLVRVDGRALLRSYSMSSAPETDTELMTTVKRVPGGAVSNWMIDNLVEGDQIELTRPRGAFCLRPAGTPLLGFSGGSGITPILSLVKSALAGTGRRVRLLCADRTRESVFFDRVLTGLGERYPGRLAVIRHVDDERGLLDAAAVRAFVGPDGEGDSYVCGPEPFMALVESALPGPGRVFSERFGGGTPLPPRSAAPAEVGTVTIVVGNKRVSVPRRDDETLLESARRGGLAPPFSCEAGNCATCIAKLTSGEVKMRNNNALLADEVAEGYVLTCQSVPISPSVAVRYE
jgi:ferredoxin-NADP reductase